MLSGAVVVLCGCALIFLNAVADVLVVQPGVPERVLDPAPVAHEPGSRVGPSLRTYAGERDGHQLCAGLCRRTGLPGLRDPVFGRLG